MSAQTAQRPETTVNPLLEIHYSCEYCHPARDRAYCGAPLRGLNFDHVPKATCVVCAEMTDEPCPECGLS